MDLLSTTDPPGANFPRGVTWFVSAQIIAPARRPMSPSPFSAAITGRFMPIQGCRQHLPAGSHERVAWRCLLEPAHTWETRVADRTSRASFCPYHMGVRVHPTESLTAYFPWLAAEWHPERNSLRPHEVTRASARRVVWRCALGHEWSAAVYQRTLSRTGCPECYRLGASARSHAGKERARQARARQAERQIAQIIQLDVAAGAVRS